MASHRAACACNQMTVVCTGEPTSVSLCHCLACQKRTGSPFGIAAFFDRAQVAISGDSQEFTRASDRGFDVTFHFCPCCGSTVYWEPRRKPQSLAVAVGCFADPSFSAPRQAVYTEHQHPWLDVQIG